MNWIKKPIFEYEFSVEHKGKKKTVQQSAHNADEAKRRITHELGGVKFLKMKRKLHYPHMEGGKKIG